MPNMNIKVDVKQVILGAGAAGLLLLGFGVFLACKPTLKAVDVARKDEQAYTQEVRLMKDVLAAKDVKGVFTQLIPRNKVSTVIDKIGKLAAKNAVTYKLLRPPFKAEKTDEAFDRVFFDIQVSGALKNIGAFFTSVRDMPEGLVDIGNLRIWPDEGKTRQLMAKTTFILLVAKDNE